MNLFNHSIKICFGQNLLLNILFTFILCSRRGKKSKLANTSLLKRKGDTKECKIVENKKSRNSNEPLHFSSIRDNCQEHSLLYDDEKDYIFRNILSFSEDNEKCAEYMKNDIYKMIWCVFKILRILKDVKKFLEGEERGDSDYWNIIREFMSVSEHPIIDQQKILINIVDKYINVEKLCNTESKMSFCQCFFSIVCFLNSKVMNSNEKTLKSRSFLKQMFSIENSACSQVKAGNFDSRTYDTDLTKLCFSKRKILMDYEGFTKEYVKCDINICLTDDLVYFTFFPKYIIFNSHEYFSYYREYFLSSESDIPLSAYFYGIKYQIIGFLFNNENYDFFKLDEENIMVDYRAEYGCNCKTEKCEWFEITKKDIYNLHQDEVIVLLKKIKDD